MTDREPTQAEIDAECERILAMSDEEMMAEMKRLALDPVIGQQLMDRATARGALEAVRILSLRLVKAEAALEQANRGGSLRNLDEDGGRS